MPRITLFNAQSGNGTSPAAQVRAVTGNTRVEGVMVRCYGTWNLATVCVQVSDDNSTFQLLKDSRGDQLGFFNMDAAILLDMQSGSYFRVVIADSGSPQSSLTVRAFGDVLEV